MMQLHQDYNEFIKRDTEIVVLGPENVEILHLIDTL